MTEQRFTIRSAVYLVLIKDAKVLLLRRYNTGWSDGKYSLLAGHVDGNESLTTAMAREAQEEAGIVLRKEDISFAHVMHRVSNEEYLDFFFTASKWEGNPMNTEPNKCDDMQWFPLDKLPENTLPYIRNVIEDINKGITFSEIDWK